MITLDITKREMTTTGKSQRSRKAPAFSIFSKSNHIFHFSFFILCCLLSSCARMGSPDGGWFDDTPPSVISSSPNDKGVNVRQQKIVINFNEFIKIEDAQNKVIVSPPQIEMADIRAAGKRILIELKDTLKDSTTYTIDFSDAISDNNEGNPMGNYTFSFSTGDVIDTLEVAGYVLNAEDLEPLKGVLVGLYPADTPDSAFHTTPMMRVSRTNGSGHFVIKGVRPGDYVAYALQDADGDFLFSQKSEAVAFSRDVIQPSWKPDTRQDTIWRDSLHIGNILSIGYTHFLPDDVTLMAFQEPQTDRHLLKTERLEPDKLTLYFTYGSDSLPMLQGLNFNSDSALVCDPSLKGDTVVYWLRDTTLINQDTLTVQLKFLATDTLGQLYLHTDTIDFLPKVSYEKRQKEAEKAREKWEKEQAKKKKRGQPYDSIYVTTKPLAPKFSVSGQVEPEQIVTIEMPQPLARCDSAGIHLYSMIDSVWYDAPFTFSQYSTRVYKMRVDWKQDREYSLEIDSAAFVNIYGGVNNPVKMGIKVQQDDQFSTLFVNLSGLPAMPDSARVIVQILDSSDKPVKMVAAGSDNVAEFYYVKPGKYYLRAFIDLNGNGIWDTGQYDSGLQAEAVYYFSEEVECKEKWDVTRNWNLTATPRFRQKPTAILKQKPEKQKQQKNRNLERARQLGIEYVKKTTGVSL